MTTIVSEANLINMPANWWSNSANITLSSVKSDYSYDYEMMYRRHMNVRICVDFLARNIAHLGLHVYARNKNNDRERVRDHAVARLLAMPMPAKYKISPYLMIEAAIADMLISGNGYLIKHKNVEGEIFSLQRVPYMFMTVVGKYIVEKYRINNLNLEYKPEDIIHFRFYNPENSTYGISPLEGLREVLAEEYEKSKYASGFWQNAARISGVIERPLEATAWSEEALKRFTAQWHDMYSGDANSGKTAVLEEGMTFRPISFSPKDTEYIESRKLNREECARAYHIPPPLVGILDHATFSNISEQNKSLYTQVLGPLCARLEGDFNVQLMSEFQNDLPGSYVEFNIEEKLQGDFSQQAEQMRQAVGVPWMTPNEARTILNLPRLDNPLADTLVTPLNMSTPEAVLAQQRKDASVDTEVETKASTVSIMPEYPELDKEFIEKWQKLLIDVFMRQRDSILPKIKMDKLNVLWDKEKWNKEVAEDFEKLTNETAWAFADAFSGELGSQYERAWMEKWLKENARIAAEYINDSTYAQLEIALGKENPVEAVKEVFVLALAGRVAQLAEERKSMVESYVEAKLADVADEIVAKTWVVTSKNPRDEHRQLNGVTVGKKEYFPNGLKHPRDYRGKADDNANCQCKIRWIRKPLDTTPLREE